MIPMRIFICISSCDITLVLNGNYDCTTIERITCNKNKVEVLAIHQTAMASKMTTLPPTAINITTFQPWV